MGHRWGLSASKPLNRKAAKHDLRAPIPQPVDLMNGRLRARIGRDLRQEILDTELAPPLQGFRVRVLFEDEAPAIGSGQRLVLCQFRGKKVILHGGGYTATIKRDAFKELVASNRRYRKRDPQRRKPLLKLVVNNPPADTSQAEAA